MTTVLAATAALVFLAGDKWEIKPAFTPKAKVAWSVVVEPEGEGRATFTAEQTILSSDEQGAKGAIGWKNIIVDGEPVMDNQEFPAVFGPRGQLVSLQSEWGDELRRMASVMVFVYPDKAVETGDKWTFEHKPVKDSDTHALNLSYEVKAVEKVKDVEALQVAVKLDEKGDNAMRAEGTFWIAKDGKVLKLDMKVKRWPVPMVGSAMDVRITAEILTEKKP